MGLLPSPSSFYSAAVAQLHEEGDSSNAVAFFFFVFFAAQRSEEGDSSVAAVAFFLCFFFPHCCNAAKKATALLPSPSFFVFLLRCVFFAMLRCSRAQRCSAALQGSAALRCSVVHCGTMQRSALWYAATQCNIA